MDIMPPMHGCGLRNIVFAQCQNADVSATNDAQTFPPDYLGVSSLRSVRYTPSRKRNSPPRRAPPAWSASNAPPKRSLQLRKRQSPLSYASPNGKVDRPDQVAQGVRPPV